MRTNSGVFLVIFGYLAFAVLWFLKTPVDTLAFVLKRADCWLDAWLNKIFKGV